MAVPGEVEVLGGRTGDLCLSLPTIPPFILVGFTTPSPQQLSEEEFPTTAVGQFPHFPQKQLSRMTRLGPPPDVLSVPSCSETWVS